MPISFHLGEVATQLCHFPHFSTPSPHRPLINNANSKSLAKSKCKSNRATMTRLISQVELRPTANPKHVLVVHSPCCQSPVPCSLFPFLSSLCAVNFHTPLCRCPASVGIIKYFALRRPRRVGIKQIYLQIEQRRDAKANSKATRLALAT